MAENRMCPHCGGQMFMAKITRPGIVEAYVNGKEPYRICKESKDNYDVEIIKCARCKESVCNDDLVTGVTCKECGKVVGPMDINSDGVCNVCEAMKQRTELANASKEDLIKMLLEAEKKANPVAAKIEKNIEKAEEVVSAPTSEETDISDVEEKKTKTRTKARKKKTDDVSENEAVEEAVATEEAVNDIANQQDAPFPEMNAPEEPAPVMENPIQPQEEQPIGAGFQMFDDTEEAF